MIIKTKLRRIKDGTIVELSYKRCIEDKVTQFINPLTSTNKSMVTFEYLKFKDELYLIGYKDYQDDIKPELERIFNLYGYELIK